MFLLDVRPPIPVGGVAGLVLLAIVVLILAVTLIVGLVFLLKLLGRRKAKAARIADGDAAQPIRPNQ